jgi:hypothetical protein
MQASQCGNQMGTKFWVYYGGNYAQFDRINVFYLGFSGGKYVTGAVLFDLEPGVIGAVSVSPLGELFRPGSLANQNAGAGNNWPKALYKKAGHEFC